MESAAAAIYYLVARPERKVVRTLPVGPKELATELANIPLLARPVIVEGRSYSYILPDCRSREMFYSAFLDPAVVKTSREWAELSYNLDSMEKQYTIFQWFEANYILELPSATVEKPLRLLEERTEEELREHLYSDVRLQLQRVLDADPAFPLERDGLGRIKLEHMQDLLNSKHFLNKIIISLKKGSNSEIKTSLLDDVIDQILLRVHAMPAIVSKMAKVWESNKYIRLENQQIEARNRTVLATRKEAESNQAKVALAVEIYFYDYLYKRTRGAQPGDEELSGLFY